MNIKLNGITIINKWFYFILILLVKLDVALLTCILYKISFSKLMDIVILNQIEFYSKLNYNYTSFLLKLESSCKRY